MRRNLFWLFLFSSSLLWADNVTVSRAEQLARTFFENQETTRSVETKTYGMVKARKRVLMPYRPFMFSIVFLKAGLLLLPVMMWQFLYWHTAILENLKLKTCHLIYKTG